MKRKTALCQCGHTQALHPKDLFCVVAYCPCRWYAPKKRNKYRAIRTPCGREECGAHASKKEALRCVELQLMERAGDISELVYQPAYEFSMNDVKICTYRADWSYHEKMKNGHWDHDETVEDCKSPVTKKLRTYQMKKKLMLAFFGIAIKET